MSDMICLSCLLPVARVGAADAASDKHVDWRCKGFFARLALHLARQRAEQCTQSVQRRDEVSRVQQSAQTRRRKPAPFSEEPARNLEQRLPPKSGCRILAASLPAAWLPLSPPSSSLLSSLPLPLPLHPTLHPLLRLQSVSVATDTHRLLHFVPFLAK